MEKLPSVRGYLPPLHPLGCHRGQGPLPIHCPHVSAQTPSLTYGRSTKTHSQLFFLDACSFGKWSTVLASAWVVSEKSFVRPQQDTGRTCCLVVSCRTQWSLHRPDVDPCRLKSSFCLLHGALVVIFVAFKGFVALHFVAFLPVAHLNSNYRNEREV